MQISTPKAKEKDKYRYIILPDLAASIQHNDLLHVKVKACHDVYIALINGESENDQLYEVVLGGWNNSKSVLRTHKQQQPAARTSVGSVLDCTRFKEFVIKWTYSTINIVLSTNPGNSCILRWWTQTKLNPIKNVGVYTGFGSTGEWIFDYKAGSILIFQILITLIMVNTRN